MATKVLLINNGVVQKLVELVNSPCIEVKEQAILALGFLSRHDHEPRDVVLMLGGVDILLKSLMETTSDVIVQKITWTLSILCGATLPQNFTIKDSKTIVTNSCHVSFRVAF